MKHSDPHLTELIQDALNDHNEENETTKSLQEWQEAMREGESWACNVEQSAFADLTYTESGYLTSYEWFVDDASPEDLNRVFVDCINANCGEFGDYEIEKANKAAEQLGIPDRWRLVVEHYQDGE